jgi:FixJ family two-component response regulator
VYRSLFGTARRGRYDMTHDPTIAVLDDDEGVRISLTSLIRSLGYQVRCYASPLEFLDDRAAGEPDCMISDIQMPEMSGDQLQAQLIAAGRNFPIIFMTAFPTPATRDRVLAAGAQAFLDKPVSGDTIAHHLETALQRA